MRRIIMSLLVTLLSSSAFAETSGPFTPVADDVSVKVINQLFGSLVNGGNDAFGSAISTFNSAIMIIGGILATYTILAGTIGTAHDGEMLGKKFSSVWIPIRYSLSTALVLPVLSGGYCIMQQIVIWLSMQGIGLADITWGAYMQTPGIAANVTPSVAMKNGALKLAKDTYFLTACAQANQTAVEKADAVLGYKEAYNYGWKLSADGKQWNFGDGQATFVSGDTQCGNIKFAEPVANSSITKNSTPTSNLGYLGPLDDLFSPTDVSPINQAHKTATTALISSMAALSKEVIELDGLNGDDADKKYQAIEKAANAYTNSVQSAAQGVARSPSDTTKSAQKYGWFLAGAYFMNTVVTNNKITNAMAAVPSSSYKESYFSEHASSFGRWVSKVIDHVEERGLGTNLMDGVIQAVTTVDLYELKNDTRHPVIIINEMGDRLQTIWIVIIGVIAAVAGVGMLASASPAGKLAGVAAKLGGAAVGGIADKALVVLALLALPILALAAMAFTAKYLIPMLPFMMWLGIIGGWIIALVIAVLAAPLWAVMHLHPNGDDLTGRGGNGYMLVLGLLLRPVLAVFGFIAAITISSVVGEFINKVFFQVFAFSQGDGNGIGWFFGMIAGAAIYIAIMFSFIKKTFGLMHVIPDELMKWIGGGGDQLGHYAGKMGEGSQGTVGAVAAFTAGRGMPQGLQNAGRQLNDITKRGVAEKQAAESKVVEGVKGFNNAAAEMDKKYGPGQGERIASILGINEKNALSASSVGNLGKFHRNADLARERGGEEAREAFIAAMEADAADNFALHGGASQAADFHGANVASNAIRREAEAQFGPEARAYLQAVAPAKSGEPNHLDLEKAEKAMADLGKAKDVLGSGFQQVFNEAMSNHGDSVAHVTARIASAYQAAKVGGNGVAQPANLQNEFPQVVDTPVFNPESGQVEGLIEPPQQPMPDSEPGSAAQPATSETTFNQATIDQFGSGSDSPPNPESTVKDNGI